jgi:hypothetical protein
MMRSCCGFFRSGVESKPRILHQKCRWKNPQADIAASRAPAAGFLVKPQLGFQSVQTGKNRMDAAGRSKNDSCGVIIARDRASACVPGGVSRTAVS